MFYLKVCYNLYNDFLVGGIDGRPQNFEFRAFKTKAQREKFLDAIYSKEFQMNGIRTTRKEVVKFHTNNFEYNRFGLCEHPSNFDYIIEQEPEITEVDKLYERICNE